MSELLEAFRAGDGVDLIRESVRMVMQELIEAEASEKIGFLGLGAFWVSAPASLSLSSCLNCSYTPGSALTPGAADVPARDRPAVVVETRAPERRGRDWIGRRPGQCRCTGGSVEAGRIRYTVYSTVMTITPDKRTLSNAVVRLDPLQPDDSDELFVAFDDEQVWAGGWGGGPAARPQHPEGMRAVVDKLISAGAAYAVRATHTGNLVGTASLLDVDLTNERCTLGGAAYSPAVWGTPVNAGTNLALLGHAFEFCGFGRVMLQTDLLNTRMQAAIEKMGASREGVLRRHKRRADGTFRDSVVFSILAEEWPATRERLSSRLTKAHGS